MRIDVYIIKKHLYIYSLILPIFIQGCATTTTKIYKAPYNAIEMELTNNFNIKLLDQNLGATKITSNAEGGGAYIDLKYSHLSTYLSSTRSYRMGSNERHKPRFTTVKYIPGKQLIAKNEYYYNILGSGSHGVLFNIEKLTNDTTRIEVNYYDNGCLLYIIPIISLGEDEEKYIHKLLFKNYEVVEQ